MIGADERHGIERGRVDDVHVRHVAGREEQRFGRVLRDQHDAAVDLELAELADETLRLRLLDAERFDDLETALADQLRKNRSERAAVHLLVDLLGEAARTRGKGDAAADEDRSAIVAVTRAAALLLLELLGRAGHVRARLLLLGSGAARIAVRDDDLVHQILAELLAEHVVGDGDRFGANDVELHVVVSSYFFAFTAGRMITSPPGAPGTDPLIAMR